MADSVPSFMAKVGRYRPRIVCFVGMGIWRTVEKVLAKTSSLSESGSSKAKSNTSGVGLQPYKLVSHSDQNGM
jgi:hypothetical protein